MSVANPRHSILLTSYSGQFAGMEIRMLQEAEYLLRQGWRVSVATRQFQGRDEFAQRLSELNVFLHYFDPPQFLGDWRFRRFNWFRALFSKPNWLCLQNFDLVHIFMPWINRGLEHAWMTSKAGIPFIISAHNAFPPFGDTNWHRSYLPDVFRCCKGIYGVSDSALDRMQQSFHQYLPEGCIQRTIYNFADTDRFTPFNNAKDELCRRLDLSLNTPVIGVVARLSSHKRPLDLLNVVHIIRESIPDIYCVFVGEGILRSEVEQRIKELSLDRNIGLMGYQRDIHRIVAGFDVHVLLSSVEGFGIATVEAMSSGVPVVATDVPGSQEIIVNGECGWLVPLGDFNLAAARIVELLRDTGLRRCFGQAGRERVLKQFSRTTWEANLQLFYHQVMN